MTASTSQAEVQLAMDDLAESCARASGPLGGGGPKVMNELIEEELTQLVGPKGKNDRARGAKRHGCRRAQVVLRATQGLSPAPVRASPTARRSRSYAPFSRFASEDQLQEQTLERVLAGLSTRRYRAASSPPPPRTARPRARPCRGTSSRAPGTRSNAYAWDWAENVGAIDATFSVGSWQDERVKPRRRVLESRSRRRRSSPGRHR